MITDDELARVAALRKQGVSQRDIAAHLGESKSWVQRRWEKVTELGLHLSSGARAAMQNAGLNGNEAKGGWIHNYELGEDGKRYKVGTTRWNTPNELLTDDALARVRSAFEGMTPSQRIKPPTSFEAETLNVIPLYDVHWGMAAWSAETGGQDYDFNLARDDVMAGLEAVLARAPRAQSGTLLLGGDLLHADDNKAQTPGHHHPLDVAGRIQQATDTLIDILKYAITRSLEHHSQLTIRVLRGNHDENSHRPVAYALREWLREQPNAHIDMDHRDLYQQQWGRTAIFGNHGDKQAPKEFTLKLADVCRFWSDCRHRYAYTGHRHTMEAQRIGGLNWERLEPFCPPDAYGSNFTNRRGIKIDSYDKRKGRVNTALDPLDRDE